MLLRSSEWSSPTRLPKGARPSGEGLASRVAPKVDGAIPRSPNCAVAWQRSRNLFKKLNSLQFFPCMTQAQCQEILNKLAALDARLTAMDPAQRGLVFGPVSPMDVAAHGSVNRASVARALENKRKRRLLTPQRKRAGRPKFTAMELIPAESSTESLSRQLQVLSLSP